MRLIRFITLFSVTMLMIALASGVMVMSISERTRAHIERVELAQASYEAHLRLESHSYQLFKQFGDAIMIGDNDAGAGERALTDLIRGDIRTIRNIIAEEIEAVGEEEFEELELLADIENQLESLFVKFENLSAAAASNDFRLRWGEFRALLDNEIDGAFRMKIEAALEEEQEEVAETRELLARDIALTRTLGLIFAASFVVLSLIGLGIYSQRVARPMARLMTGVEEMQQGALMRPFEKTGTVEIDQIGEVLNAVAADVKSRQDALVNENTSLGETLADRNVELERLLDEAKEHAQARQRMLADVSHELRTPLTIIQGESDITLRNANATEAELREALTRAKTAAEHTSAIVNDLLLISRQEEGQLKLDKKQTDLGGLVEDSILLAPLPVSLDNASTGLSATVDRLRMRQALLALLQNAHSHGATGARISLAKDGDMCRISVDDDGPGMSESDRAQAFSRFFRGSNAAGNYGGGFGLGLPIVKSIVAAHGGSVALEDSPMGGLSVQLSLPLTSGLRAVS